MFSAAEVLSLLEAEGELDDPDEVFAEGSDEDFDELGRTGRRQWQQN